MRLIGTETSPFTRKVRIAAHELGIALEFIIDAPLAEASRVPALNPLGKVPVLVRDDGTTLIESGLICRWLDQRGPTHALLPERTPASTEVLQWQAVADGVLDAAVLVRMEALRPEGLRSAAWVQRQRDKIERGLQWLDSGIGARPWCVGDQLTLADIALGCAVGYLRFRFPEEDWYTRFAALIAHAGRLEARASFQSAPFRG